MIRHPKVFEFRTLLWISHTDLFWQAFDDYINAHKKEILEYIASAYKQAAINKKGEVMKELNDIQSVLDKIKQ